MGFQVLRLDGLLDAIGKVQHRFVAFHLYPHLEPAKTLRPAFLKGFFGSEASCEGGEWVGLGQAILEFGRGEVPFQKTLGVFVPHRLKALQTYDVGSDGDDGHRL